jgi:hypothetical protein
MVNIYSGNAPTPGFTGRELHEQYTAKQKKKYGGVNQDAASTDNFGGRTMFHSFEDLALADVEAAQILVNMRSSSPYRDPSAQLDAAQTMIAMRQCSIPVTTSAPSSFPPPVSGPTTNVSAIILVGSTKISLHEYGLWKASGVKEYSEYLAWKNIHMGFEPSKTPPGKIEAKKARE